MSNTADAGRFTIVGLKASWRPLKNLPLEGGVDNITDRNYELDLGFPSPGRVWYANLRHEF